MRDSQIYSGIFDIVNENMKDSGKNFQLSKPAFMYMTEDLPQSADIYEISKETDNSVFLEKCYIALLKRLPEQGARENMRNRFSLPPLEFQKKMVLTVLKSLEYRNVNVRAFNNIYSEVINSGEPIREKLSMKMTVIEKMYMIYKKQPEFAKKIERKIFGRIKRHL